MKKILVIEDEPEMRRNLITILRLEKFRPLPAENGRVGVELAKKEKPDLILCDVMMPELDGYGVLAALRADTETVAIPFIFLTAKGEKPEIRAGMVSVPMIISPNQLLNLTSWPRSAHVWSGPSS